MEMEPGRVIRFFSLDGGKIVKDIFDPGLDLTIENIVQFAIVDPMVSAFQIGKKRNGESIFKTALLGAGISYLGKVYSKDQTIPAYEGEYNSHGRISVLYVVKNTVAEYAVELRGGEVIPLMPLSKVYDPDQGKLIFPAKKSIKPSSSAKKKPKGMKFE